MDLFSSELDNEESSFPSLVILVLLGSHPFGQLAPWGVGDKHGDMVATRSEPVLLLACLPGLSAVLHFLKLERLVGFVWLVIWFVGKF